MPHLTTRRKWEGLDLFGSKCHNGYLQFVTVLHKCPCIVVNVGACIYKVEDS